MQQKLAVASVLVLVVLAGASAILIQEHAYGQSQPNTAQQSQSNHSTPSNFPSASNTNSTGGSLLTSNVHNSTGFDDGNETEHETETEFATTNSTLDN